MDRERALAQKLYRFAAAGFYLAALGFLAAAVMGGNFVYYPLGAAFICIGTAFLPLGKQRGGNDGEQGKDTPEK